MKIQLNTDTNIDAGEALAGQVTATIEQALEHFSKHITRISLDQAVQGAAKKLAHLLDSTLGRLNDHRERTTVSPVAGSEAAQT